MEMIVKPFAAAMLAYFGKLPGQSNTQFMIELRALDDADKAWFAANLPSVGITVQQAA
jgi:hypothetical protein